MRVKELGDYDKLLVDNYLYTLDDSIKYQVGDYYLLQNPDLDYGTVINLAREVFLHEDGYYVY